MLKQPIYVEFDLDARTSPSKLIAISHVDDKYSETLEVAVKQNDRFVYMGGVSVVARMVLHREKDYLLSDNVPCTINANGNILIPFDNAVVKTRQGTVKIEVSISRDEDRLTLQFPLWVSVKGSVLDGAEVTPDSEGTIPDLLKEAADALEDATEALEKLGSYDNLDDKPRINGVTLSGDKTPDELGLQKKLTAGDNVEIDADGRISAKDTNNYNDLSNIPVFVTNSAGTQQLPLRGKFSLFGFEFGYIPESDIHTIQIEFVNGKQILFDSIPNDRLANYWLYMQTHMVGKDFPLSDLYNKYTNDIIWTYDGLNDTPSVVDEVVAVMQIKDVAYRTIQILIGKKFETESSPFHYECYIREKVGIQDFSDWTVLGTGYTLTQQDKTDIANIVLQELPTTQGVLYGNASN